MSSIVKNNQSELIYKSLCELGTFKESQPILVYVFKPGEEKIMQIVLRMLGNGGSKRAYELEGGKALLMPNGRSLTALAKVKTKWSEMVDDEIMGTNRVKELGLLACNLERVNVSMTDDSTLSVPAYRTESFSQLALKGIWIIDQKNVESSTWNKSFFQETMDPYDEKNWETLLNPFLKDIAKLLSNDFWLYIDNVNMAVLEKSNGNDDVKYEVRYFGFDFSSKYGQLSFKKLSSEDISSIVRTIVSDSLRCLMGYVFNNQNREKVSGLFDKVKERSIAQILSQIKQ